MIRALLALALAGWLGGCGDGDSAMEGHPDVAPIADMAVDQAVFDPAPQAITVSVGALEFDAIVAGPADGVGVILLHGFPQTHFAWDAWLQPLADAGFRVVAPNQRGYSPGARPMAVEAYAIDALADDVLGIADALGFDRFHLVGHDWGAAIAWYLAATHPERLLTVAPLSVPHLTALADAIANPDSDQADRSGYFELFRNPAAQDLMLANDAAILRSQVWADLPMATIDAYLAVLGTSEALGAALHWYRANDLAMAPALPPITVPTLYVWGDADPALGPDAAMATAGFVAGPYRFEIVEGGTHWLPELNAAEVLPLVQDHLGR